MKHSMKRRNFLKSLTAVGATASCFSLSKAPAMTDWTEGRYGPLLPDPAGILDLPAGFTYHLFSQCGELMDDGFQVPSALDGMAAFPGPQGTTILVRNHELSAKDKRTQPYRDRKTWETLPAELRYDLGTSEKHLCGGTSTLVYDTKSKKLLKHYLSLAGTSTNCAGGKTPWNTWISCEETTVLSLDGGEDNDHGYCFEVDPYADKLQPPKRLKHLGRFRHEAVAIDPRDGIVYLTEDIAVGLFYRFIPEIPNDLTAPGRLQALSVIDLPGKSLANRKDLGPDVIPLNQKMKTTWVDLEDVHNPKNDLMVRGKAKGANTFCRGEGIDYGNGQIVFTCTSGGPALQGQVWRYTPGQNSGKPNEAPGALELFCEPNDAAIMSMVDNICVAPNGDLITVEDNTEIHARVLGITPQGQVYEIARNIKNKHELAGCTWSPDKKTLFFNIFDEGGTVAVTGPW